MSHSGPVRPRIPGRLDAVSETYGMGAHNAGCTNRSTLLCIPWLTLTRDLPKLSVRHPLLVDIPLEQSFTWAPSITVAEQVHC